MVCEHTQQIDRKLERKNNSSYEILLQSKLLHVSGTTTMKSWADLGQDICRGCRGGKDHEAKVTTPFRELWGQAPPKCFEFWVSETAFPGEIPTYTTH